MRAPPRARPASQVDGNDGLLEELVVFLDLHAYVPGAGHDEVSFADGVHASALGGDGDRRRAVPHRGHPKHQGYFARITVRASASLPVARSPETQGRGVFSVGAQGGVPGDRRAKPAFRERGKRAFSRYLGAWARSRGGLAWVEEDAVTWIEERRVAAGQATE